MRSTAVLLKKPANLLSRDFSKTSLMDSIFQSPTQSKSSDKVFLIKTEDYNYVFEHDIFHNNLKDNVYGQVYS